MSISEAGGISDEMTVEFTPGPVHPPAMTTVELRVVVTMPTSAWVSGDFSSESIRQRHERFRWLYYDKAETVASVTAFICDRRFTVAHRVGLWEVIDGYDLAIAKFGNERHARHYADRLEADPSLVDDA